MKRILFITAFPPCQKTAGQDYSRRLILDLLEKGHAVSLVHAEYSGHSAELPDSVPVLRMISPSVRNCVRNPFFHPFFTKRFDEKTLRFIQSVASGYDMLYFDFSQVHLYSLFIGHPCKVLMCHDVIAQKFSRKGRLQLPWIKRTEEKLLRSASMIVTPSKKDRDYIASAYKLIAFAVNQYLKNGRFTYKNETVLPKAFCFYGAWNRTENAEGLEWFLRTVYPRITSDFHFVVIGGGMSESLQDKLKSYKNVLYLGFVDEPVKEIAKCQALIAPLFKGAGVKVKVIDALSSGTAVIGTDVAFEGIEDNAENRLFFRAHAPLEFSALLNNWRNISAAQKQAAADEFYSRYNTNHFADMIPR